MTNILERFGLVFVGVFEGAGRWFTMLWRTMTWGLRPPFELREWLRQMVRVGVDSVPVVFLTTMFTGMVLALQTYNGFQRVHAESFVASVVALAMLRELSPVLVGLMVTGRVGSSMAAEIGTMRVTEQIDALRTLATHPVDYLVAPRLLATVIALPLLTGESIAIGIAAAVLDQDVTEDGDHHDRAADEDEERRQLTEGDPDPERCQRRLQGADQRGVRRRDQPSADGE